MTHKNQQVANGISCRVRVSAFLWLAVAALAALPVAAALGAGSEPSFTALEGALTCQCGCGLTVHSCNHLQCPSAIPLRKEIRAQIGKGLSHDEILAYFANKYGEKILSAPTMRGFNLTAWITPFAAVILGGVLIMLMLLRWRRAGGKGVEVPAIDSTEDADADAYNEILDRELKGFDR